MRIMMLAWLIVAVAVGFTVVRLVTRQLSSGSASDQDRRLAEQAEQIEELEAEVQRVKDQADFTERLLTERGGAPPADGREEDPPD